MAFSSDYNRIRTGCVQLEELNERSNSESVFELLKVKARRNNCFVLYVLVYHTVRINKTSFSIVHEKVVACG